MKVIKLQSDDKIFDITYCKYGGTLELYEEFGERFIGKSETEVINKFYKEKNDPKIEIVKIRELK